MRIVTRWWWIRHAPVTQDDGRIYGQTDLSCNVSDTPKFKALAQALPRDAVWLTSNLCRTRETAHAIRAHGVPVAREFVLPDLAEQHFGEWQGQVRTEILAKYAPPSGFWIAPADHVPPGGESFSAMMKRVTAAIDRVTSEHSGSHIVAVAHGGTIRAALGHALGLPPPLALSFAVDNCSLTRVDHVVAGGDVHWHIVTVNDNLGRGVTFSARL